ncbi:MAG TPA: hypothetical protein ENN33_05435 [Ignavibacteria bacterium]|nr:hypothetical protein [Ignavibacteria bacterium]
MIAIYLLSLFLKEYMRTKNNWNLYYFTSFTVLTISGLLLIALGYGVLKSPIVVIVAALIPLSLSTGLVEEYFQQYNKPYLLFVVIGFLLLSITRFVGPHLISTIILAAVHSVAGLTIFFLPLLLVKKNRVRKDFAWITVGGTLIGIGGISLAFLKVGAPILSAEIIFTILAPVLFLMTVSFAVGFKSGLR